MEGSTSEFVDAAAESFLLEPGFVYFNRKSVVVQAVLGNAVSVCLWDRNLHCGGMNNFVFPHTSDRRKTTSRYGNVATTTLVKMLEEAGSKRKDIVAQIFGGGAPEGEEWADVREIGERNIEAARRVLASKHIKVVGEDVGGIMGRKVMFDIASGHVAVLKVHEIRKSDWHHDEG